MQQNAPRVVTFLSSERTNSPGTHQDATTRGAMSVPRTENHPVSRHPDASRGALTDPYVHKPEAQGPEEMGNGGELRLAK